MTYFSSCQSFVQRTFPPLIGSLTSPAVEDICKKNNLSFVELLAPFSNVYVDQVLKDPSGHDLSIKHLKLGVQDIRVELPPAPAIARTLLNEAVSRAWCDVSQEFALPKVRVDVPTECPWFEAWRETFLEVQFPSEHEFTRHLLGCILVTSSQDPPEMMQTLLETLKEKQLPSPSRLPKWFCPAIFKFYVIVHDTSSGDNASARTFFESIKTAYGAAQCFFLEINSRQNGENSILNYWLELKQRLPPPSQLGAESGPSSTSVPDIQHPLSPEEGSSTEEASIVCGSYLSSRDLDALRELMCNVVRNALLPHVEKQIFLLNDLVANKKGMSRSLLSATKRLFGSPRPPGPTPAAVFSPDAPELQLRRLGDLYFIFSSYANAFQAYYTAKRELGMEQAWLHYAGALEMAALSAFMTPEPSKKAVEYMEEAITTYLNACQMPQFATRATLLSVECLKEREMYAEAAKQLIRMTSEDSDLRSALLLEQAAYCVLKDSKARKYAFHMVLAGYRFSKANQRRHALRCVRQALQVYGGRGWGLADDHLHSTVGRLAGQLCAMSSPGVDQRLLGEGLRALEQLLRSRSRQAPAQQATNLYDYLNMYKLIDKEEGLLMDMLPLPLIEENSARVRVVAADRSSGGTEAFETDRPDEVVRWARMEELGLIEVGTAPMVFRPSFPVYSKATLNSQGPVMAVNERLEVQLALQNPLQISLPLARIRLLWTWTDDTAESAADASTEELPCLLLPPQATHLVTLSVSPKRSGSLRVTGIAYELTTAVDNMPEKEPPVVRGRLDIPVRGPKLRPPKETPSAECYADDRRLHATVMVAAPLLAVTGVEGSIHMLCGEMRQLQLQLLNLGNAPVKSLHVVSDAVGLLAVIPDHITRSRTIHDENETSQPPFQVLGVGLKSGGLVPGAVINLGLWVRAPDSRPNDCIPLHLLLIYYGSGNTHRVHRITIKLILTQSIQGSAIATNSPQSGTEGLNVCVSVSNQFTSPASLNCLSLASLQWSLDHLVSLHGTGDIVVQPGENSHLVCVAKRGGGVTSEPKDTITPLISDLLMNRASKQLLVLGLIWKTEGAEGLSIVEVAAVSGLRSTPPDVTERSAHSLTIFGPDRSYSSDESTDLTEEKHVSVCLSHPSTVTHCFNQNKVCLVDVLATVSNSSTRNLSVEVNAADLQRLAVGPVQRSHVYTPHAASAFSWVGRARCRLEVPASGRATLTLRAAFTRPGTYDLAVRLQAAVRTDARLIPVPAAPESPLIVIDAPSVQAS